MAKNIAIILGCMREVLAHCAVPGYDVFDEDTLFILALLSASQGLPCNVGSDPFTARESFIQHLLKIKSDQEQRGNNDTVDLLCYFFLELMSIANFLATEGLSTTFQSMPNALRHLQERDVLLALRRLPGQHMHVASVRGNLTNISFRLSYLVT